MQRATSRCFRSNPPGLYNGLENALTRARLIRWRVICNTSLEVLEDPKPLTLQKMTNRPMPSISGQMIPQQAATSGWALATLAALLLSCSAVSDPTGSTPERPQGTVTIAFIADQYWEPPDESTRSRAVLRLIRDEGADAVMHQGDFDYRDDPAAWEQQIDDILGADFPYFVSVGNHDRFAWHDDAGYQDRMEQRLLRLAIPWEGNLGERAAITFRGIFMVFGAPDIFDSDSTDYAAYFADRLSADRSTWSICS